jgi:hypothetical protein
LDSGASSVKLGKRVRTTWLVILAGVALAWTGCAMQSRRAIETERLLAAAGFQMQFADTPRRAAQLEALEQRKLVSQPRNGGVYVIYADARWCECLYAGTEQAYRRYRKLALHRQAGEAESLAPVESGGPPLDWVTWGPWGPWW